ncbi:hypothetical protein [Alicyclobacillus mengziensis]|uniref:Uncharacterized protein n=1 Tax=Alicyclobacillus mengziensis TaxID=2931921 RepID=A0A9X7W102_9BACL|nr:hypothetical protein [Alicyclobacillus mengziensis]QSO48457.1 hypothetical protein JZ786_05565 [Alicyclobacillus mengziensis]
MDEGGQTVVRSNGEGLLEVGHARVYSYTKIPLFILYCLVLIGLLIWALTGTFRLSSMQGAVPNWFHFDIPWLFLVIVIWMPTIQRLSNAKTLVNFRMDTLNSICVIEDGDFAGTWQLHKRSPRSMSLMKALTVVGLFMIVFIVIINLMEIHRAVNAINKANAVQGLCEAGILLGVFVPLLSFWRYPYLIALRQKGQWLSLQAKDLP